VIALPLALAALLVLLTARTGLAGLGRLAELNPRYGGLVLAACAAQVLNVVTQQARLGWVVLSVVLVALFCWCNRERPGMRWIALGLALNALVMLANGGVMPATPEALAVVHGGTATVGAPLPWAKAAVLAESTARLDWLGDRLLLPGPLAGLAAWSLGDIALLLGVGRLLYATMQPPHQYAMVGA
jgi:hypothetical protein